MIYSHLKLLLYYISSKLFSYSCHHWCELSFIDELFLQPQHFPMLRFHYFPDFFHVYKWVQFAVDVMTAVKYYHTESTDMRLLKANMFSVPTTFLLRLSGVFSVHICSVFGVDCNFCWCLSFSFSMSTHCLASLRFWHILFVSLSCFFASAGLSSVWSYRFRSTKN